MKRILFHFVVMLAAFAIGVCLSVSFRDQTDSTLSGDIPGLENSLQECSNPGFFSSEMLRAVPAVNGPAKVLRIRLADENSPMSDFLVDVENVSSRKITDLYYIFEPFADCPNAEWLNKDRVSTNYPEVVDFAPPRILLPRQTITLRISGKRFEEQLKARNRWQCPCSVRSELWFYGAGFVGAPFYEY